MEYKNTPKKKRKNIKTGLSGCGLSPPYIGFGGKETLSRDEKRSTLAISYEHKEFWMLKLTNK